MKKILFLLIGILCLCCCSSSEDEEQAKENIEEITSDYLCSTLYWVNKDSSKPNRTTYWFGRAYNNYIGMKYDDFSYINEKKGKSFEYKINAPYIELTFNDGSKENIKVYAVKSENNKYISINGVYYFGFFDGTNIK